MSSAREIKTKFTFEVDHEKLKKLEDGLESIKHRLAFLGGVELAHLLIGLSEKFSAFAENIHVASTSAGIGVEAFQKLAFAARQSAVPQEQLETSLARLSRTLYKAREGSAEAQKAFSQAGFTPDQIRGFKTSQEALLALGDRIKGIQDPIQRVALAQALLGRGSQRMVGFLAQGSAAIRGMGNESERLGLILSEKQIEALTRAEQSLQKFGALVQAVAANIAANFAPSLVAAIDKMFQFYEVNRKLIEINIRAWVYNFSFALGFIYGVITDLISLLVKLAKYFHIEDQILPIVATIAGMVGGILALGAAFNVVGSAVVGVLTAVKLLNTALITTAIRALPFLPLAAAVGLAGYAAYRLDKSTAEATGHESFLQHLIGGNKTLTNFAGENGLLPKSVAGPLDAFSAQNSSSVQVLAPITQNITGSDAGEIADKSARGLTEHVSGASNRAIRRGVTSNKAY